jgi:hypothetical protein
VVYHLGVVLTLRALDRINSMTNRGAIALGVLSGALILFRSEFVLFAIASIGIEACRGKRAITVVAASTMILVLLPWTIRNAVTLEGFVPLTTNAGLNLYRGHNPVEIGAWNDEDVLEELSRLEPGSDFEIRMQRMYLDHAIAHIVSDPLAALEKGFVKLFHLWVLNPAEDRSVHPLYLWPWLGVLVLAFLGFWKNRSWEKFRHLYMFLLCSSIITFVFFALPRYQTMMKVGVIPFAAHGLATLIGSRRQGPSIV